jgi:hypothetical protein
MLSKVVVSFLIVLADENVNDSDVVSAVTSLFTFDIDLKWCNKSIYSYTI